MRSAALHSRFALFRCPICQGSLAFAERRLSCPRSHSFDLAKSGYVNLAPARRHAPAAGGDTRQQLARRARFLARGHFDFIADMIAAQARDAEAILDAGCGTGFHLARLKEQWPRSRGAGIDLSKDAAAWCARSERDMGFAVADIWAGWPIHDRSVDLVTSIFAPKNHAETARVLRPGGLLALVFPGEHHLRELRETFDLLRLPDDKAALYRARLSAHFDDLVPKRVVRRTWFDQSDIADAILMGPNARHLPQSMQMRRSMEVTIDVAFLFARRGRL